MRQTFNIIDGHTCGNPVRLVTGGSIPHLKGASMFEKRMDFLANHDHIRTGLMFEPRGHDLMSGAILYPPSSDAYDVGVLYIETTGCLPMCGHGTIGTVTFIIEHGLITPKTEGVLRLETPAGLVLAYYEKAGDKVKSVRLVNIPSFLYGENYTLDVKGLGDITFDVAYGGNFYAIIEQLDHVTIADILLYSPQIRVAFNEKYKIAHPENAAINKLTHVLWAGEAKNGGSMRNAVFYGDKAIDRSPCGTGTSARMAQLAAKNRLSEGDVFVHESIIGSIFKGRIEGRAKVGTLDAIIPSIEGWAIATGYATIFLDPKDPFHKGFSVV
jgi:4-hydroxyproline epimerase